METKGKVIVHQAFIIDLKVLQHEIEVQNENIESNDFKEDEIDGDKQTTVAHALMRMCIIAAQEKQLMHGQKYLMHGIANSILYDLRIPLNIDYANGGFYIIPI
jgi:hypothetical protein